MLFGCGFFWFGCRQSLLFYRNWNLGKELGVVFALAAIALCSFGTFLAVVQFTYARLRVYQNGVETEQFWRRKFRKWSSMAEIRVVGNGIQFEYTDGRNSRFFLTLSKEDRSRLIKIFERFLSGKNRPVTS